MGALASLLRYVEYIRGIYIADHSITVQEKMAGNTVQIDMTSVEALEILENAHHSKSKKVKEYI